MGPVTATVQGTAAREDSVDSHMTRAHRPATSPREALRRRPPIRKRRILGVAVAALCAASLTPTTALERPRTTSPGGLQPQRAPQRPAHEDSNPTSASEVVAAPSASDYVVTCADPRGALSSVHACRLLPDGTVDSTWNANGAGSCLASLAGLNRNVLPWSDGGAFVAWVDSRRGDPDIYLQRLASGGTPAEGWPAGGLLVCGEGGSQYQLDMAMDGSGGVLLAWQDYRDAGRGRIYFQRIGADGQVAEGWPAGGRPANSGLAEQTSPKIVADGLGGAYLAWSERAGRRLQLRIGRRTASGDSVPGWPAAGQAITDFFRTVRSLAIAVGTNGRAALVWQETDTLGVSSLQAIRLAADHDPGAGLPSPTALVPSAGDLSAPTLRSFGDEIVAVWSEWQSGTGSVFAQRLSLESPLLTNSSKIAVGSGLLGGNAPVVLVDSAGASIAWVSHAGGSSDVHVQRITALGSRMSGWDSSGVVLGSGTGHRYAPSLAPDGAGGLIVTWMDSGDPRSAGPLARVGEVSIRLLQAIATPGRARITWLLHGAAGESLEVERRQINAEWSVIAHSAPDDSGHVALDDRGAPAGTTVEYRLVRVLGEARYNFPAARLDIPRIPATLAIHWARAEPGRNTILLSIALPTSGAGELQLHDVTGRRVARQRLEGFEPGEHEVTFELSSRLASGVYFLRLQHAGKSRTTKIALIR